MHFDTASPHLYSSRQSAHIPPHSGASFSPCGASFPPTCHFQVSFSRAECSSAIPFQHLAQFPNIIISELISIPVIFMDGIPILSWLHWDIPFRLHFSGHLLTRKAKVVASDLIPSKFGHNLDGLTTNFLTHLTGSKSGSSLFTYAYLNESYFRNAYGYFYIHLYHNSN